MMVMMVTQGFCWLLSVLSVASRGCPGGCQDPNGSFSSRVMWHRNAQLVSYMYYSGKNNNCGDPWEWTGGEITSKFQRVDMYIKINDVGKSNGVQTVWLDGKRVLNKSNIRYRTNGDNLIEKFTLQNYHGGSDHRWEPSKKQFVWFDDFVLREGLCSGASSLGGNEDLNGADQRMEDLVLDLVGQKADSDDDDDVDENKNVAAKSGSRRMLLH